MFQTVHYPGIMHGHFSHTDSYLLQVTVNLFTKCDFIHPLYPAWTVLHPHRHVTCYKWRLNCLQRVTVWQGQLSLSIRTQGTMDNKNMIYLYLHSYILFSIKYLILLTPPTYNYTHVVQVQFSHIQIGWQYNIDGQFRICPSLYNTCIFRSTF